MSGDMIYPLHSQGRFSVSGRRRNKGQTVFQAFIQTLNEPRPLNPFAVNRSAVQLGVEDMQIEDFFSHEVSFIT